MKKLTPEEIAVVKNPKNIINCNKNISWTYDVSAYLGKEATFVTGEIVPFTEEFIGFT